MVVEEGEKSLVAEKPTGENDAAVDGEKEAEKTEVEEKEPEDKVNNSYNRICCFRIILIAFLSVPRIICSFLMLNEEHNKSCCVFSD